MKRNDTAPATRPVVLTLALTAAVALTAVPLTLYAQDAEGDRPVRGGGAGEYAARQQLRQGEAYLTAGDTERGTNMLQRVIDQFPDSDVRFEAYLMLGEHVLNEGNHAQAVIYFSKLRELGERHAENPLRDDLLDMYLKSMYLTGVAHYETKQYSKAFPVLRRITADHPNSVWANQAFYYIGMCHFMQENWKQAISALTLVGTFVDPNSPTIEYAEAGRRLFVKIEDEDLPVLDALGEEITVTATAKSGDTATVPARPLSSDRTLWIASVATEIGDPVDEAALNENAEEADRVPVTLQVRGGDSVRVSYLDDNTQEGKKDVAREAEVKIVSTGAVSFVLRTYTDKAVAVFQGQPMYVLAEDVDEDVSEGADQVEVTVVSRYKVDPEDEAAAAAAAGEAAADEGDASLTERFGFEEQTEQYAVRDEVTLRLTELPKVERAAVELLPTGDEQPSPGGPADAEADADEPAAAATGGAVHTGRFGGSADVVAYTDDSAIDRTDNVLTAAVDDEVVVTYVDNRHINGESPQEAQARLRVAGRLEQNVIARQNVVTDDVLKARKNLVEATAFLELARIFNSMGLSDGASDKADQGLERVDPVIVMTTPIPSELRETAYQLKWELYIAQGEYAKAITVCKMFNQRYPDSPFVDQALMGIGRIRMEEEAFADAIAIFNEVIRLQNSQAKAEAQFMIAKALEQHAEQSFHASGGRKGRAEFSIRDAEAAVQAYRECAKKYPDSAYAGESLGKLVEYYMKTQDYVAADDLLEQVFVEHPDAGFLDKMLLAWVEVAYKNGDIRKAYDKAQELILVYPGSIYAEEVKKVIPALERRLPKDGE